ncbi:S8 family serine peptidase [Thalassotalea fonticola]|uniref:S8 family serine peptidase n=1 Tax=Thalassotalea fonticola TaxID=3065649 RepID=A0ABZ0GRP2_9GAMM|nr:S8 family serine peptidase [Colwelliaceae bacterium S1-1]
MKFKLTTILSALPILLASQQFSALAFAQHEIAYTSDDGEASMLRSVDNKAGYYIFNNRFNEKQRTATSDYLVVLADEPLATYAGQVNDLPATNILASKQANSTEKGKLNTKSLASKRYKHYLAGKQSEQQLYIDLRLKRDVAVDTHYDTVLNGFSAKISASEARIIAQMPGVIAVNKFETMQLTTDRGPKFSGAEQIWAGSSAFDGFKGEGIVVGVIDSGIASFLQPVEDINDLDNLPDFNPSFADKVDEDGDGIIDYDHTNPYGDGVYFGDCIAKPGWCNDKLVGVVGVGVFGRDLVNRSLQDNRSATGQDTYGHGSHVASTIAGNVVRNIKTETEMGTSLEALFPQDFIYEQISGVAPHANIISYQVCGKHGSCNEKEAIEAIEHAINNDVDVLNYSIGKAPSIPWYDHTSLAFLRAREAGIHVAVSAGNSGMSGRGSMRTPGNAPWLLSVAATSHDRAFDEKVLTLSGGDTMFDLESQTLVGAGATQGLTATDVVYAGDVEYRQDITHEHEHTHINDAGFTWQDQHENIYDEDDPQHRWYHWEMQQNRGRYTHTHEHSHRDAVEKFGIEGACGLGSLDPDKVAGKVIICNRGGSVNGRGMSRVSKSFAVKAAGGAGMILINTDETPDNLVADWHSVPSIQLEEKTGELLLDWLAAGEDHQVAISASTLISSTSLAPEEDFSAVVGVFSSQGPDVFSSDYLVPQIAAPGVSVLASGLGYGMQEYDKHPSQISRTDAVYQTGTSMASPHIAGMLALMKGLKPEWTPSQVQSALMLTAGTELKFNGPIVKKKQTFIPAEIHSTGAGLANVGRAVNSALVMTETYDGYMQADPYGDVVFIRLPAIAGEAEEPIESIRDLVKELPDGWHGKPERMNLASLSKGECQGSCSWSRTFTATKDATWNVSYSYTTKGMVLTSNKDNGPFTVKAGENFSIIVTATVNHELDTNWSDGRVHLTATDESIPSVSLPVTVQFKAGKAPKEINIVAHRNEGSAPLAGVSTVGSDDFTTTVSPLSKAKLYSTSIKRSMSPYYYEDDKDSVFVVPVSIPARSDRLIIEVLETTSPDIDLYLGYDANLDGEAGAFEIRAGQVLNRATMAALELLDVPSPPNGDFWLLVHNYGNQFNHLEDPDYDPVAEQTYDDIKLAVTVVSDDLEVHGEDELKVSAPKENYANSIVPIDIHWQEDMQEDDRFYGMIGLSTKEELGINIGMVNVNIARGVDDVALSLIENDSANSLASYKISFMANNTTHDKEYQMSLDLEPGALLETITIDSVIDGATTSAEPLTVEQDGEQLTWTYTHSANSTASEVVIVFNYQNVSGKSDITPYVTSMLDDSELIQIARTKQPTMVQGKPFFMVEASNTLVMTGEVVSLDAIVVDAVIDSPQISYQWQQTEGPEVVASIDESQLSFTVPEFKHDEAITFELIGSNGERQSNPVLTTVYVTGIDNDKGGSSGFIWFALLLSGLVLRRKK